MSVTQFKQIPAAEALRRFSEINDAALKEPVVLTRNGRARTVLLSVEAFERFLANERSVFLAKDTRRSSSVNSGRSPRGTSLPPACGRR